MEPVHNYLPPWTRFIAAVCALLVAIVAPGDASVPDRYFDPRALGLRANHSLCTSNSHPCTDIGFDEKCCSNDHYCYITPANLAKCCPVGILCDSACDSAFYQCNVTITQTITIALVATASSFDATRSLSIITSTSSACCGRACTQTGFFLCEASTGGLCCPYETACGSPAYCLPAATATGPVITWSHSSESPSAIQNPTTQTSTIQTLLPSGGPVGGHGSGGGLSDAARAAISASAVVSAAVILGLVAWKCVARRYRTSGKALGSSPDSAAGPATSEVVSNPAQRPRVPHFIGPGQQVMPPTGPYSFDPSYSPNQHAAVPSCPDGPGDITQAYELDSKPCLSSLGLAEVMVDESHSPTPGFDAATPLSFSPSSPSRFHDVSPLAEDPYGRSADSETVHELVTVHELTGRASPLAQSIPPARGVSQWTPWTAEWDNRLDEL